MRTKTDQARAGETAVVPSDVHAPTVTGHTPGPWRVKKIEYPAGQDVSFEVTARNRFVAQTIMREVADEGALIATDEANARLIAAAPELLAALKLFKLTEESIVSGTAKTLTVVLPFELISKAAAAIAKAEGR